MRKSPRTRRPSSSAAPAEPDHQQWQRQVAAKAYELYEARGFQDGHDVEDWLAAEQSLSRQSR
ncbi:MAG: DUF2934 domain-containing protein [Nitrospiraceae bacterium]|nr:DUF2934 domain-containing protein [Nitrospiraceae bacterium]